MPWDPSSLTNLVAWWDASDPGVSVTGGHVVSVNDKSGNGHTLYPISGGTVPFNSASAYNSKPAFDFDGSSGCGLITNSSGVAGSPSVTLPSPAHLSVFVVTRMASSCGANTGLVSIGG